MTSTTAKRRGRPPLGDGLGRKGGQISTRLPADALDRTIARAQRERVPPSTLVRRAVLKLLDDDRDDD